MQLAIELELTPDTEVLYSAASTARLVIGRFYLWVPRLEPSGLYDDQIYFRIPKNQLNGLICEKGIQLQLLLEIAVILETQQALTD